MTFEEKFQKAVVNYKGKDDGDPGFTFTLT